MLTIEETRKAEKARRMLEKAGRMPLNNVILQIQDGVIDIKDVIGLIETKSKALKGGN